MPGFDEAFRREEARQRSADAAQQSKDAQRHNDAEAVTSQIAQLLQEFSRGLAARGIQPERVEIAERRGLLHPAKYSPAGYITGTSFVSRLGNTYRTSLFIVTPTGDLWQWSRDDATRSGFVAITSESLARDKLWIAGDDRLKVGPDRRAQVYRNGDPPTLTPLEDWLAARAVKLIKERSASR